MSQLGIQMADEGHRGPRVERHRRRRQRRRRRRSLLAGLLALVVVIAIGGALFVGGRALIDLAQSAFAPPEDYAGPGSGEVALTIAPGASIREIGQELENADVVASVEAFVAAAEENPASTGIQAGDYLLKAQMKSADAIVAMLESTTVTGRVTIPEGFRKSQIIDRLAKQTSFDPAGIEAAVAAAQLPAYAEGDAEGFLFPATYDLKSDTDAPALVTSMVTRFQQAATELNLEAGAQARGLTPRQLVTVASIVQREVAREQDMPMVAEVIYNRLSGACTANGVPAQRLQMDSTVHYATNDYSSVFSSAAERQTASPYNTYLNPGLPPGPISSPGEAALRAALTPSAAGYCYFVTVNLETGETKFAVSTADHAANTAELQAYCRQTDAC